MINKLCRIVPIMLFLFACSFCSALAIVINNNPVDKVIIFGNSNIKITLDYNSKCNISGL